MGNNPPQKNFIFSSLVFTKLRAIARSFSKELLVIIPPLEGICGMGPVCFLYSAVLLGMFSSLSTLKAESSASSLVYQKDNFSIYPQEALSNNSNVSPQNKRKTQTSTYSLESTPREIKSLEVNPTSFFEKRAEGWHWYESLSDDKVEKKKQKNAPTSPPQTPTEKVEVQRKELETKLHTAILEPSVENIITYILAQKALMDQSQRFSEAWQRVIITTPSLDETLIHPVDQNARHVYYDEQRHKLSKKIQDLASEYGLFFFFRKNCPYCHHFAPIVKRFANKYNWSVLGISLDGGTLSEFPHAKRDNGISERLGIFHVPALIALHSKTGKLIPLAYGMVSENEIEGRIKLLTQMTEVKK